MERIAGHDGSREVRHYAGG